MSYKPSFYYICIFLNTFFRFWWLIGAIGLKFKGPAFFLQNFELLSLAGMMVEAIRRTLWSIIRVENEFFNNFENYRDIIAIPPVKEDNEIQN